MKLVNSKCEMCTSFGMEGVYILEGPVWLNDLSYLVSCSVDFRAMKCLLIWINQCKVMFQNISMKPFFVNEPCIINCIFPLHIELVMIFVPSFFNVDFEMFWKSFVCYVTSCFVNLFLSMYVSKTWFDEISSYMGREMHLLVHWPCHLYYLR
jgi:hypothetical protein